VGFDISYTWAAMPRLLEGAVVTLQISISALFFSVLLATLLTIVRTTGFRPAMVVINVYISYIRGTPLLIQIFLVFYMLPVIGIDLAPLTAGIVALSLSSAAFTTEIMRGGLAAIPKGQIEAARSLGLSQAVTWRKIILPQLFNLIIPPLANEFTLVIKSTPLVSVITVVEMMRMAQQMYNANFRPVEVLLGVAMIFFVINFTLVRFAGHIERRNARKLA
jgi:His/Glu/Gln/Arg/opine family amino acid ABC transporter permease subunit